MRARRALLYVPGDDRHKIDKAITLGVDSICLDLEDGVAPNRKTVARQTIKAALRELFFGRTEKLVRINPVGSGLDADDLKTVLPDHPDGIVVPKAEEPRAFKSIIRQLEAAELEHGWPVHSVRLLIGIETPKAILHLGELAALPRLDALIFGGEDFAAGIGATRTQAGGELTYARQAVVVAAAAYGLQAIDIVNIDFKDMEALRLEATAGARLGYAGKQVIHPAQVEPVQKAFTPDDDAVSSARHLLEAFAAHQKGGKAVFAVEGKMIDMPLVRQAHNILDRARAAGKA